MVDPNIVAISPSGVGALATSLQPKMSDASRPKTSYRSQFAGAGVPAGSLDSAYRALGRGEDRLPVFRRRVELAQQIDDGVGNRFVRLGLPQDMQTTNDLTMPVLRYGNFGASFLERVGVRELFAANGPKTEPSVAIWIAISKDPKASFGVALICERTNGG